MVKVKVCGMTNLDDCRAAIDVGVDFIGFVFYRRSPRYVAPDTVASIIGRLGTAVRTVGVFVEETDEEIERAMAACGLDLAQVYRPCGLGRSITVVRVRGARPKVPAKGTILFDTYTGTFGGSGLSFDLRLIRGHEALPRAFIAGGLNEGNLSHVLALAPYGIDLVSSVEEYKGRKSRAAMEKFMKKARSIRL